MRGARRRQRMSPDDVRRTRLRQIGFRKGYDPVAVDDLLAHLADEIADRDRELAALAGRLEHAQREIYARRHGHLPDAAPTGFDPATIDTHMRAQRYAEELVATAQQSAAAIVAQSRQQAHTIMAHAHAEAEQAARDYRARAGADYSADREELVRIATLARWAMGQISGLRYQVDATDDAARAQLATILDRLGPLLEEPAAPAAPADPYRAGYVGDRPVPPV
jgi:DivIVA domain-containing protein